MTSTTDHPSEFDHVLDARHERRPLFSPETLAQHLGVPLRTVYKWRGMDYGPKGFKVGRHVRYTPESVDAWVAEQADADDEARRSA